jgi:hypothetical protein
VGTATDIKSLVGMMVASDLRLAERELKVKGL